MYTIQNQILSASFSPIGAQLCSVLDRRGKEWLWQAEPHVWPWHAPLCFPVVGRLRDQSYTHNGETYPMPNHGFARNMEFEAVLQSKNAISFQLLSNEETKKSYPFDFELTISYALEDNILRKTHQINNNGTDTLYYEIGGHDAFAISWDDHTFSIPKTPTLQSYRQDEDGMILPQKLFIPQPDGQIPLDFRPHGLDCYLFTNLAQRQVTIHNTKGKPVLSMDFQDFPYLVLWSKCDLFYCVEPWSSLPDCTYVSPELKDKIAVRKLRAGCGEKLVYTTEFYL